MKQFLCLMLLMAATVIVTGCSTSPTALPAQSTTLKAHAYRLNTGDQIKVTVFGEDELSGTYQIDGMGAVSLPLIGDVMIGDQTLPMAQETIKQGYAADYLKDPKITVQMAQYRPFYILGEVQKPGSYPYVDQMTVLNAVVLGGGFTYRADKGDVSIKRVVKKGAGQETKIYTGGLETLVLPGDIIEINERFF